MPVAIGVALALIAFMSLFFRRRTYVKPAYLDPVWNVPVIDDVTVFDGQRWIGVHTVTIANGKVDRLLPKSTLVPGAKPEVFGLGRALLPGFIDCHVHLEILNGRRALAAGITSARDLGWPLQDVTRIARATQEDLRAGPHLLFAGPMLTATGGYPRWAPWAPEGTAREIDSADEARAAVYVLAVEHGVSVIKVAQEPRQGPTLPLDVLRAVCDAAHEHGLKVTSHCGALSELTKALEAGVDELAHGLWSDEEIPAKTIARMVAAGMTVVPTLHVDPSLARIENVRRFTAAGGRVVYGTDMGNPPATAGIDVEELRLMQQAGLTLDQTLSAATSTAAEYLGLAGRGRIFEGAIADLILIDGDPAKDLGVLARPSLVIREGTPVT